MSKYASQPLGFARLDNQPLESNVNFPVTDGKSGYQAASEYVGSDPTSYPGQILAAEHADHTWALYMVTGAKLLQRVLTVAVASFTNESLTAGILYVSGERPPIGVQSQETGKYFAVSPLELVKSGDNAGLYKLDFGNYSFEGKWDIIW